MVTTHVVLREPATCLSLPETLDCGQCFRWTEDGNGRWQGVLGHLPLTLWMEEETLCCQGASEEEYRALVRPWLALDEDYPALQQSFRRDPVLAAAIDYAPGIRVLRQQPWEALCSFIISQNNFVGRIRGIIERLCALLGEEVAPGRYAFPTPDRLAAATVEELAPLQAGYRARYLLDAARKVADGVVSLEEAAALPTDEARARLMEICGVGRKVADCALLYGFGRDECVPMDVWMKRMTAAFYPDGMPQWLLPKAGLAQQYLFHYGRTCPSALEPGFWERKEKA